MELAPEKESFNLQQLEMALELCYISSISLAIQRYVPYWKINLILFICYFYNHLPRSTLTISQFAILIKQLHFHQQLEIDFFFLFSSFITFFCTCRNNNSIFLFLFSIITFTHKFYVGMRLYLQYIINNLVINVLFLQRTVFNSTLELRYYLNFKQLKEINFHLKNSNVKIWLMFFILSTRKSTDCCVIFFCQIEFTTTNSEFRNNSSHRFLLCLFCDNTNQPK